MTPFILLNMSRAIYISRAIMPLAISFSLGQNLIEHTNQTVILTDIQKALINNNRNNILFSIVRAIGFIPLRAAFGAMGGSLRGAIQPVVPILPQSFQTVMSPRSYTLDKTLFKAYLNSDNTLCWYFGSDFQSYVTVLGVKLIGMSIVIIIVYFIVRKILTVFYNYSIYRYQLSLKNQNNNNNNRKNSNNPYNMIKLN